MCRLRSLIIAVFLGCPTLVVAQEAGSQKGPPEKPPQESSSSEDGSEKSEGDEEESSTLTDEIPEEVKTIAPISTHLLYQTKTGFYVDVGSDAGLERGLMGWLEYKGERWTRIRVRAVAKGSSFLELLSPRNGQYPKRGELLVIIPDPPATERGAIELVLAEEDPLPLEPRDLAEPIQFEPIPELDLTDGPLLVNAQPKYGTNTTEAKNLFRGRLTVQQGVQVTSDGDMDWTRSRVRSSGSVDRIDATPWALEYSGDFSIRAGDGFQNVRDFEDPRIELYQFAFARRFDDRSILRLGRFIPRELPSIGYMDGLQYEKNVSEKFRYGTVLGLKPTRDDLDPSFNEPTVVPYFTFFRRKADNRYFSATFGTLFSSYEGEPDRIALLADQEWRSGNWFVTSSSEFDFDAGNAEVNTGFQLSRWDLVFTRFNRYWTPRFGINRWQRPDTQAERDIVDDFILQDVAFFDDEYWRYFAGASHRFGSWTLSEEVSYTDAFDYDAVRWNVALSKNRIFGHSGSTGTISVYNLASNQQEGFGGRLSAFLALGKGRVTLEPSVSVRWVDFGGDEDFSFGDVSLRYAWNLSQRWRLTGGASFASNDEAQRYLVDVALTFFW